MHQGFSSVGPMACRQNSMNTLLSDKNLRIARITGFFSGYTGNSRGYIGIMLG